jgi:hypothetical protein
MQCKGRIGTDGRRFASTDPVVIRALPPVLRDELPVTLLANGASDPQSWNWQPIGVSKSLWAVVIGCIGEGLGKEATLRIVRAAQQSFPVPTMSKDDGVAEDDAEDMELQHPPDAMHVDEPAHDNTEVRKASLWLYDPSSALTILTGGWIYGDLEESPSSSYCTA